MRIFEDRIDRLPAISSSEQIPGGWASSVWIQGRIVVLVRGPLLERCPFLCPLMFHARIFVQDGEHWIEHETSIVTDDVPSIAGGGFGTLLLLDRYSNHRTVELRGLSIVPGHNYQRGGRGRAIWADGRFVIASPGTSVAFLWPNDGSIDLQINFPDAAGESSDRTRTMPYLPAVVEQGGKLYVVSSEVSMEQHDGMVRRLRIHELEQLWSRQRPSHRAR